jgi:toxin ParE1/3/4
MACVIWTEPAIRDLEEIADYIALDNEDAACRFVQRVFATVSRLENFPLSGKRPKELPEGRYREIFMPPCRIFYRVAADTVYVLHVMRSERVLRMESIYRESLK